MNSDSGSNLLVTSEKVEEPAIAVSGNPSGSYSSGAKKPPGTNDTSKKHKSSKVCDYCINMENYWIMNIV